MEDLRALIELYPYNDYRRYPLLKEREKKQAMYLKGAFIFGARR